MLTREKLLKLLEQHRLSHHADEILSQCKPSIHLSLQYGVDEADIPIGASKMGGSPDVPPDFVWPQWNGIPLTFIAQFRLSDVKPYDVEDLLPEEGMLYFFFEKSSWYEMEFHATRGSSGPYKVIFYEEDESIHLERIVHPITPYKTWFIKPYRSSTMAFETELTIPSPERYFLKFESYEAALANAKANEVVDGNLAEFWSTAKKSIAQPMHRLLGDETDIQFNWSMREDANSAWNIGKPEDWTLLLELDTDRLLGGKGFPEFYWGDDHGLCYIWINSHDLKTCYFERVWLEIIAY